MSTDKDPEPTEAAATIEALLAACKPLATEPHDRRLLRQLGSATADPNVVIVGNGEILALPGASALSDIVIDDGLYCDGFE